MDILELIIFIENLIKFILAILIVVIIAWFDKINKESEKNNNVPIQPIPITKNPAPAPAPSPFSNDYQAKRIVTNNEWRQYKLLRQYTDIHFLLVFPKVRLLDIVEPKYGRQNYRGLLQRVMSKHVDFVICDQELTIKAVVEIDDNSHNRADRQQRDRFVDTVLTSTGYKVVHTRYITEKTYELLDKLIYPEKQVETEAGESSPTEEFDESQLIY